MAKLGDFCAFTAAIDLLKISGQQHIIDEVYQKCKEQENLPKEEIVNYVKEIYKPFDYEENSLVLVVKNSSQLERELYLTIQM